MFNFIAVLLIEYAATAVTFHGLRWMSETPAPKFKSKKLKKSLTKYGKRK